MKFKKLLFIFPLLLLMQHAEAQETTEQKFKMVAWLVGKWNRTNPKQGESGYETWTKVSSSRLTGKGVTMKGDQVVFLEHLEFIVKGADIFYVVSLGGQSKPVYFKLTAVDKDSFSCENPTHDFPKVISYKRTGDQVKAVISGDGKSIDYNFVRTKKSYP
ncbi:MAG: hypothetical protein EOO20_20215 [Chryseobacterium sp.]|nr:MAG: hypothetical protein EOO20_20215 [Chryseobacterium sp.]